MGGFRLASQRVMARAAAELLSDRPTWFISLGNSMTPSIRAVQKVELRPVRQGEPLIGRIVLAEVGGRYWLHRVSEERADETYIVGDNGMVNGWTPRAAVFGVVESARGRRHGSTSSRPPAT